MSVFIILAGKNKGLAAKYDAAEAKIDFVKTEVSIWGKVKYIPTTASIKLVDIASLEVIESQLVKKDDSLVFGAVGAAIAGPIGMALGAGLGRVQRPCTFSIKDKKGNEHILEGQRMWFDLIAKHYRIALVE